jgi:hypothetical protein
LEGTQYDGFEKVHWYLNVFLVNCSGSGTRKGSGSSDE